MPLLRPSSLRPFQQLDVFSAQPYAGNPLAVVLEGQGLSDAQMQQFARWTQLSETTFLLPPTQAQADYRVRIFTPAGELPFAGHPTLGSCHAWLQAGGQPRQAHTIVQESALGLVPVRREGSRLAFAAPTLQRHTPEAAEVQAVALALGLPHAQILAAQWLDNGPRWLGLLLDSRHTVLQLQPDHGALKALGIKVGVIGLDAHALHGAAPSAHTPPAAPGPTLITRSNREARAFGARSTAAPGPHADDSLCEVRAFAAAIGVAEDPVTGSLNASLAQWLMAEGHLPPQYVAAQGQCLGRAGRVHIAQDAQGQVWVGGDVVCCIQGQVRL